MKIIYIILFTMVLIIHQFDVKGQNITNLDSLFQSNFSVLDSVLNKKKSMNELNESNVYFLYLISDWADLDSIGMDYTGIPKFTKKHLIKMKSWYSLNMDRINIKDINLCISIYQQTPTSTDIDSLINVLDSISKFYKN